MPEPSDSEQAGGSPRRSPDAALDDARALLAGAEAELRDIELAIDRLEAGTYSTCELCGAPIEPERLGAVATERRCGAHGASD